MKLVTCFALILTANALLGPASGPLRLSRALGDDDVDIPSELTKINELITKDTKSWGWTSEVIEDKKIEVSKKIDEKSLAIFDVKIEKLTLNDKSPTEYIIFTNIAAGPEDTRFARFKTAHLMYRREYTQALQKEIERYLLIVLQGFKQAHDFYSVDFDSKTLGEKISKSVAQFFEGKFTEEVIYGEPNFYSSKLTTVAEPKISLTLNLLPLPQNYFKLELINGQKTFVTYVNSLMVKNFDQKLQAFVSQALVQATPQKVDLTGIIELLKKKANSQCGGNEVPVEVEQGEVPAAVLKFTPAGDAHCTFTDSTIVIVILEMNGSQFLHLKFDGVHLEGEYILPISPEALENNLTFRLKDIIQTDQVIELSLANSKTETELTIFDIDDYLKRILGDDVTQYELDADAKKDYEGEGRSVVRAYQTEKKGLNIVVVKMDAEYVLVVNFPSRRSFSRIQLQSINGYNQFELLKTQMNEILTH